MVSSVVVDDKTGIDDDEVVESIAAIVVQLVVSRGIDFIRERERMRNPHQSRERR
jgi:hypothetical protein